MKRYMYQFVALLSTVLLLQACGSKAVNEPGVDVQPPSVAIVSPVQGDSIGTDALLVQVQASDNDKVDRVEIYINTTDSPYTVLTSAPWEVQIPSSEFPEGNHTIFVRAFDPTGNASSLRSVSVRKGEAVVEEVQRITLAELVTSANCAPCGLQNETWQHESETSEFKLRTATIRYHVWWPRTTDKLWQESSEWSRPRTMYLFSPMPENEFAAPKGWIGGKMIGPRATDWITAANNDMAKPAGAKIDLSATREGNGINLMISVKGLTTSEYQDLRLHTVITENDIEYNDGNSEFIHFNVMRRMYPDAGGERVTIANGQTTTYQRVMPIEAHWNPEKLEIVVFLQSNGSKEILQAAKIKL